MGRSARGKHTHPCSRGPWNPLSCKLIQILNICFIAGNKNLGSALWLVCATRVPLGSMFVTAFFPSELTQPHEVVISWLSLSPAMRGQKCYQQAI